MNREKRTRFDRSERKGIEEENQRKKQTKGTER